MFRLISAHTNLHLSWLNKKSNTVKLNSKCSIHPVNTSQYKVLPYASILVAIKYSFHSALNLKTVQ